MRSLKAACAAATTLLCAAPAAHAATRYLSPLGSDAGTCTAAAPCRSFDRAYHAAAPGDVVAVAPGTYPGQTITADASKTSAARVVFTPATAAPVTLSGELHVYGRHIEVRNMRTDGTSAESGASDVVFRNLTSESLFISSASNIAVIGGSVGPGDSFDSQITADDTSGAAVPTNILIDGVVFHDWTRNRDPSAHVECLQFGAGQNVVIRNSRFIRCATHDVFIRSWGGTAHINDFTLENNFFGRTIEGYYAVHVAITDGQDYDGVLFRNNSAVQPLLVDDGAASNVRFIANVAPRSSDACYHYTYLYNVWDGARCGATDKDAPSGFVNPATVDLHLRPNSAAIDAGDPSSYPATDIDGGVRPHGRAPDAGADEFGAVAPRPGGGQGGGGGSGGVKGGHRRAHTRITLHVKRIKRTRHRVHVRVRGRLRPAVKGRVRITVQRKRHGHWRKVEAIRVRVHKHGRFAAKLWLHRGRRYRAVARYTGNARYAPSRSAARRIRR